MSIGGLSENVATILMLTMILLFSVILAYIFIYSAGNTNPVDYTINYAVVEAEIIPALFAHNVWNADSVKITFTSENEPGGIYEKGAYLETENINFLLYDPKGNSHEAVQSLSMKGQKIGQGAVFYYYTLSSDINGQYYITNQYARIGDDSTWPGAPGPTWSYPKPFAKGTWRIVIKDRNKNKIISEDEVIFS